MVIALLLAGSLFTGIGPVAPARSHVLHAVVSPGGARAERRLLADGWHGVVADSRGVVMRDLGADFFPLAWSGGRVLGFATIENGHDIEDVIPLTIDAAGRRGAWNEAPPDDELLASWAGGNAGPSAGSATTTGFIVCVDPGHGGPGAAKWNGVNGDGAGARGPNGLTEQWVNLRVSALLMEYLAADPRFAGSFRTRTTETAAVSLADRTALAAQGGAALFVSVHHNALPEGTPNRTETFYCRRNPACADLAAWKVPAQLAHDEVAAAFGYGARGALEDSSGTGRFHFFVLRYSAMPSTLCEASNLNGDASEEALFGLDPAEVHARAEARALYRAILRFFGLSTTGAEESWDPEAGADFRLGAPAASAGRAFRVPYDAAAPGRYDAGIVDILGRRVRDLDAIEGPGRGTISWDGSNRSGAAAPAGDYWLVVARDGRVRASVRLARRP